MVGLEAAGKGSRQADGGIAVGGDGDLACGVNQVKVTHQLTHRRHHFRGQAPAEAADVRARGFFRQDPLPQVGHRPVPKIGVDFFVYVVLDDPGNLVLLIGDGGIFPQISQGHRREDHLCGDPLLGAFRRQARQLVAGLFLVGLGQDLL